MQQVCLTIIIIGTDFHPGRNKSTSHARESRVSCRQARGLPMAKWKSEPPSEINTKRSKSSTIIIEPKRDQSIPDAIWNSDSEMFTLSFIT